MQEAGKGVLPAFLRPLAARLAAVHPAYVLVLPRALQAWQQGLFAHALAYNTLEAGVSVLHLQPAAVRLQSASQALLNGAAGVCVLLRVLHIPTVTLLTSKSAQASCTEGCRRHMCHSQPSAQPSLRLGTCTTRRWVQVLRLCPHLTMSHCQAAC